MEKPFYESKTLWFNVLFGLVALAGVFGFADFQPSENTVEIVAVLVAAANIALRLVTKQPVAIK